MMKRSSENIYCVRDIHFRRKPVRLIKGNAASFKLFRAEKDMCLGGVCIFVAAKWKVYIIKARISD